MLAGFAAHGEPPGHIGARAEPALHGLTDGHVLVLHFFTHLDALAVVWRRLFADIREVIVENDRALVHPRRQDEICVHHACIGVDHEIRIEPQIKRPPLARCRYARFRFGAGRKRAGLQASALEIFNGVFRVLDHAAQPFVRVRHVVAAVEIIVHVDFPVAVQHVSAAVEVL